MSAAGLTLATMIPLWLLFHAEWLLNATDVKRVHDFSPLDPEARFLLWSEEQQVYQRRAHPYERGCA